MHGKRLEDISINEIMPNRFQPRIHFDEDKIESLAKSIIKYGVLEPIIVRPLNGKYEIIAGERRFKASKLAGKATIPAIIVEYNDKESIELALLENIQRQELTAIEEAIAYRRILDMGYITQEELAKKTGKSQPTIANKMRLLSLDDETQDALINHKISERHARSLLKLTGTGKEVSMLNRIIKERLTVRQTDEEIMKVLNTSEKDAVKSINSSEDNGLPKKEKVSTFVPIDLNQIESLFDDINVEPTKEKKGEIENMDIEKMMQEAQDINANQIPKDMREFIKVPSPYDTIMPDAVTPQANDIADIMNTSDQTEQNKFINILPVEEPEEKEIRKEDIKPTVTFDSVFNSAFSTPVINESKQEPENTQSIVNPSNEIPPLATELSTQFVPENNTPVIPEVPEITAENSDFIPTFTSPLDEIEHEVSSASPVMETIPYAKNGFEEMPEKVDISSATSIPDLSPVLENKIEDVIQPSVQESVKTEIPSITIDEPAGGEEIPEFTSTIAESAPNFTPNFENPIEVPSLTQSEIDFKPVNEINAVDIKEVVPEVMNNSVTQDNLESNSMSEIKNIEYALNIIKSCSEQLKKEGFEININELDLGMIYQVSITINKN